MIRVIIGAAIAVLFMASTAQADQLLAGAQACTKYFKKAERYHNIPTHWLAAISNTESGRYHKGLGMLLPWPWTINVNGKGYYFDTKEEAIRKINEYRAKGVTSIDVGCMQVNMHYHGHAFANIHQALDPRYNVAYAARFLRENYDDLRSWKEATAAYHSRTPSLGGKYFKRVFSRWENVVSKLGASTDSETLWAERPKMKKGSKYAGFSVNKGKPKQKAVKMKVIKVSDATAVRPSPIAVSPSYRQSQQNGVMVSRPAVPMPATFSYQKTVAAPVAPVSVRSTYEQQSANHATYQPNPVF